MKDLISPTDYLCSEDCERHLSPKNRLVSDYSCGTQFVRKKSEFSCQYANIYSTRLEKLRSRLESAAGLKWGPDVPVRKLSEIVFEERCILIGTIFKQMELQPSILKEISEGRGLDVPAPRSKYVGDKDSLILEDEVQRIVLDGSLFDKDYYVTGVNVSVIGKEFESSSGRFLVEDFCFASVPIQSPWPHIEEDRFVLFLSGLNFGSDEANSMLPLQVLCDAIAGFGGDPNLQDLMRCVTRCVIAGNCVSKSTRKLDDLNKAKYLTKNTTAGSIEAVRMLDICLEKLVKFVPVDVMPGEFDPCNLTLPQQPLHPCMVPLSCKYKGLGLATNPYSFKLDGLSFLGSSGQCVDDITRYSVLSNHLDVLEKTLQFQHICPTAPDTLSCYPYSEDDPFVLLECPHVFFSGNSDEFASRVWRGPNGQEVVLLVIPDFSRTQKAVLFNLKSKECFPIELMLSV